MVTTHRVLFFNQGQCVEIPLHYVGQVEKLGGIFATDGIKLHLTNQGTRAPYVEDYYTNVTKRPEMMPDPPSLGSAVSMRFHDKTRNQFLEHLNESLKQRQWEQKIITESMKRMGMGEATAPAQNPGKVYGGLNAIRQRKEEQSAYTSDQITNAFQDLESLKEKSRSMVQIAETIKSKLANNELDAQSDEMKEIQAVMFNMGMASDFSTMVSKETSGNNYHSALALEVEKFLDQVVDKLGGVVGLVDLYCMYNRARGMDLISPDDLKIACQRLNQTSQRYMIKEYGSGVVTMQSRMFNEDSYYQKLAQAIAETGMGMTAVKLAEKLNVNAVLMKEHLLAAELKGAVCRDESYEGVQFYENRILA